MEINNEYEYLVHLVKCGLNNLIPVEMPKHLSYEKVLHYGKLHEVANIAFLGVENMQAKPVQEVYDKWKAFYYSAIKRDILQHETLALVLEKLHAENIRTLQVQGTVIKPLYPSSDLRMMSDIDLIVDKSNLLKASQILMQEGFITQEQNDEEWSGTNNSQIKIELHTDFFYSVRTFQNGIKCSAILNNAFSLAKGDGLDYFLDNTNLFLFNLLHCLKHFLSDGAGIRRILDLYVLKNALKDIDYKHIEQVLKDCKLPNLYNKLMALADYWFSDKQVQGDFEKVKEFVFLAENHGSRKFLIKKKLSKSKTKKKRFAKIRYIFSRIFINKQLCYKAHPFCEKHKYPLFLCWVHRILVLIFCKNKKRIKKELKDVKDTKI